MVSPGREQGIDSISMDRTSCRVGNGFGRHVSRNVRTPHRQLGPVICRVRQRHKFPLRSLRRNPTSMMPPNSADAEKSESQCLRVSRRSLEGKTDYCSWVNSALAALRMGMPGSASFHSFRKSW
jgi:hypothetical protein